MKNNPNKCNFERKSTGSLPFDSITKMDISLLCNMKINCSQIPSVSSNLTEKRPALKMLYQLYDSDTQSGFVLLSLVASTQASAGRCQHDSDTAADGSRCGGRSTDSRPGGGRWHSLKTRPQKRPVTCHINFFQPAAVCFLHTTYRAFPSVLRNHSAGICKTLDRQYA